MNELFQCFTISKAFDKSHKTPGKYFFFIEYKPHIWSTNSKRERSVA